MTIYNRFVRWSRLGFFNKIVSELARKAGKSFRLMIDATHLKAHRTAVNLLKGPIPRRIGRKKGGLNSKLHAVCDDPGGLVVLMLSEGQMVRSCSGRQCDHGVRRAIETARAKAREYVG